MAATIDGVHDAAHKMNRDGLKPTYAGIRAIMGKVSYSVIAEGLRTWVPELPNVENPEPTPTDILQSAQSFGTRIWEAALATATKRADEKVIQVQSHLDHTLDNLQSVIATADQASADNEQLKSEAESLKAALSKCRNTLTARDKELIAAKSEIETLRRTIDQFSQSLLNSGRSVPAASGA